MNTSNRRSFIKGSSALAFASIISPTFQSHAAEQLDRFGGWKGKKFEATGFFQPGGLTHTGMAFQLIVEGVNGQSMQVEASNDFSIWDSIGNGAVVKGVYSPSDTNVDMVPNRFYRALLSE